MNVQSAPDGDGSNLVDKQFRPDSMEVDMENVLSIETLTNLDKYKLIQHAHSVSQVQENPDEGIVIDNVLVVDECKSTRPYRSYSNKDKEAFFSLWIDRIGDSVSEIARKLKIHPRTAQKWVKEYKESGNEEIPISKRSANTRCGQLKDDHKRHIVTYLGENPGARLDEMMDSLADNFNALKVSKSSLHRFVHDECFFTFKLARKECVDRNSPDKVKQRYVFAESVLASNIDYSKNCVFIDEAAFNINMKRSGGWAPKGETPVVKTPLTRAENRSVLGAVCYEGVVLMSLRKPITPLQSKKRKLQSEVSIPTPKGTTSGHFKRFLMDAMNVLDQYPSFKNAFLVMDNASIHKNSSIVRLITSRGYRCLYLPPFSPELNPIEQVWHMMKSSLKRERLLSRETLTTRITEAANAIPEEKIQHCIDHSTNCLLKCLNMEPL